MKRVLLVSLGLIAIASYAGCLPEEGPPREPAEGRAAAARRGHHGPGRQRRDGGHLGRRGHRWRATPAHGRHGWLQRDGRHWRCQLDRAARAVPARRPARAAPATAGTSRQRRTWRHRRFDRGHGRGSAGRGGTGGGTAGSGRGHDRHRGRGGTTGTAGTTGTGGTPGPITIPELFPTSGTLGSLDGRLVVMPCGDDNTAGTDCGGGGGVLSTAGATTATSIACSGGNLNVNQIFYVGGVAGQNYNVTIHVYGISEPKNYGTGVTREAGTTDRPPRRRARAPRRRPGRRRQAATRTRSRTTTRTRSAFAGPAPARPATRRTSTTSTPTPRGALDVRPELRKARSPLWVAARCAYGTTTVTAADQELRTVRRGREPVRQRRRTPRSSTSPPRCRSRRPSRRPRAGCCSRTSRRRARRALPDSGCSSTRSDQLRNAAVH